MQVARPRTPFVGRAEELEKIAQALTEAPACVTLVGPGGAGKTRLALEVAASREDAVVAELAGIADPEVVLQRAAAAAGVPSGDDPERVSAALAERPGLLVLDNCEHVLGAAAAAASALLAGGWRVLATSRAPLAIDGERLVPVPPLAHPDPREAPALGTLARYDAIALFTERARSAEPSFELTPANAPAVIEICARLDGIPLALELAAARIAVLSPAQVAERLSNRFGLLTSSRTDADPRQRTLEATIAWGFDLLDEAERALLTRAALLAGRFDLETLEHACTDDALPPDRVLDTVASLAAQSLLVVEPGERTAYRLLDSVREFAASREPDPARWRARIVAWAADVTSAAGAGLKGPGQAAWVARLAMLHDTLMGALADAETIDPEAGLRICNPVWTHWDARGVAKEVVGHLERLFAAAPDAEPRLRVGAMAALGMIYGNLGLRDRAREAAEHAVVLAEASAESRLLSKALNTLGSVRARMGDIEAARDIFARAVAAEREDPTKELPSLIANLATMCHEVRDLERARELYDEAAELYRAEGDRAHLGALMMNRATLLHETGDVEGALDGYRGSLEIAREMGDRRTEVMLCLNIGNAEADRGDADAALRWYRDGLAGAREIAFPHAVSILAQSIFLIAAHRGNPAPWLRAKLAIARIGAEWAVGISMHDHTPIDRADRAAAALPEAERARIEHASASLGLDDLADEAATVVEQLVSGAPAPAETTGATPTHGTFRRDGDVWEVGFGSGPFRLKDAKGLAYLAVLLARPHTDVHVADLVGATGVADEQGVRRALADAGEQIDQEAARAFAEKIRDLEAEREEALSWSDTARAERLAAQIDEITAHLTSAYGLAGRARRTADPAERMRKAVTNRIRDAISRIEAEHAELGRYLRNTVHTGTFCAYRPDRPVRWDL